MDCGSAPNCRYPSVTACLVVGVAEAFAIEPVGVLIELNLTWWRDRPSGWLYVISGSDTRNNGIRGAVVQQFLSTL